MFKDFNSQFNVICEEEITRFKSGGYLVGDYVTISPKCLKNKKIKEMGDEYLKIINYLLNTKNPIRVVSIRSTRPDDSDDLYGRGSAFNGFWLGCAEMTSPTMWHDTAFIPMEVCDRVDLGNNLPPIPDHWKYDNKEIIKPIEVKFNGKNTTEMLHQTQGDKRQLEDDNTKIPSKSAKDPKIDKPRKFRESVELADLTMDILKG